MLIFSFTVFPSLLSACSFAYAAFFNTYFILHIISPGGNYMNSVSCINKAISVINYQNIFANIEQNVNGLYDF